jgi:hypothetical protein
MRSAIGRIASPILGLIVGILAVLIMEVPEAAPVSHLAISVAFKPGGLSEGERSQVVQDFSLIDQITDHLGATVRNVDALKFPSSNIMGQICAGKISERLAETVLRLVHISDLLRVAVGIGDTMLGNLVFRMVAKRTAHAIPAFGDYRDSIGLWIKVCGKDDALVKQAKDGSANIELALSVVSKLQDEFKAFNK